MLTGSQHTGSRLRRALEGRQGAPRTITWLQREMEARGARGSGYSNIQRHVAGNADHPPPTDWIEAAAEILGVRSAWLAFGEEPVLPDAATAIPAHQLTPAIKLVAGDHGAAVMARLVQRLVVAQPSGSTHPTEEDLDYLAGTIHSRALDFLHSVRAGTTPEEAERFYLAFLTALLAAIPRPGQGREVTEVQNLLGEPTSDLFRPAWHPETGAFAPGARPKKMPAKNRNTE